MLGGATGGTTQDALVGANVAANAATNNHLSAKEIDDKVAAIKRCDADSKCISTIEKKYNRLSSFNANSALNSGVVSKVILESDRQELQQKLQGGACNMPSTCYAEVNRSINEIDSLIESMPAREAALTMLEYASVAVDVGSVLWGLVELRLAAKAAAALGKVATTGGAKGEVSIYRAFGGDARAQGFSWTTEDPRIISNFRDVAGLPSGGPSGAINTANFLIEGRANAADIIKSRSALPLDGNMGGLPELIIDPKNVKIIDFSILKP